MIWTQRAADAAELARWKVGRRAATDWLASGPAPEEVRPMLVRVLDRPGRGGAFGRALAGYLGADLDTLYAEHYPRKAARLASQCRSQGNDPHAAKLHAALVALMFCANCGRPLADPLSIDRGIGPDCWPKIDPQWRAAISKRLAAATGSAPAITPPLPGSAAQGGLW